MTTVRDVLLRDPTKTPIPNLGVAKLGMPRQAGEWDVLRYELTSFVCDGEYRRGLDLVLATFLGRLGQEQQPAAWVSGFYGSGKSHFVRVLDALWRDIAFPDGARARGLTHGLPQEILDHFLELDTAGRREGGLWSASGTLSSGAGTSVRLAMLGVVFQAAGLPAEYPPGKFLLWLMREGHLDSFREALARRGYAPEDVLDDMYVSQPLAEALLEVVPTFASDVTAAHDLLARQFVMKTELSSEEFLSTVEDVLRMQSTTKGKLPLTLLVFDEMQQFLAGDPRRISEVQEIVQDCSAKFGSRVLFVATGQMQLTASGDLQKLQDRFSVKVTLSDSDVEKVVREVVLRKHADKVALVEQTLERVAGEIGRHLGGSRIEARPSDRPDLVPDYPLLPARRRFWEAVLRSVDHGGTKGQLRAQLDIVHRATAEVASEALGWVIPADALYWHLEGHLQTSGELPRDTASLVRDQAGAGDDGELRRRICALVFLIGKLEVNGIGAAGVKSTVETLADLLVEDLNAGSAALRQKLPDVLAALVDDGLLVPIGDEYRLLTKVGAEWEQDFRRHLTSISNDLSRITDSRSNELRNAVGLATAKIRPQQGNVSRRIELHFGPDAPPKNTGGIPIWVRHGWDTLESAVRADAQQAGPDSATVFVFLPRATGDDLAKAIAGVAAADTTLNSRPSPATPEGIEAKAAIESRRRLEQQKLDARITDVLAQARVFAGGGNEVVAGSLEASVRQAADDAKGRLYPKFAIADHGGWGKAVEEARKGTPDPLSHVGHMGDADQHPVCQEVRNFVSPGGKKGLDVRKHFMAEPYGWGQDAIDGALLALVTGGFMRAKLNAQPVSARQLPQNQVGSAEFASEGTVIQAPHRIRVRKLAADIGYPIKQGEELEAIRPILDRLLGLAGRAGGDAPAPPTPSTLDIQQLLGMAGNEQFMAVHDEADALTAKYHDWTAREMAIGKRVPGWQQLRRLLKHADALAVRGEVEPAADAILTGRSLLTDPDPVAPLTQRLCDALRAAVTDARDRLQAAHDAAMASLEATPDWQALDPADRASILAATGLGQAPVIQVGDPGALLSTLDAHPLEDWEEKLVALPGRIANAREMAARKLQPAAVRVTAKGATLRTAADVEAYLADLRAAIMVHIDDNKPVIL